MGNNIKKFRKQKGLSLQELSQMCSLSVSYLSHLEIGTRENPSYSAMTRICKALDKNISDIFMD